MRPAHKHRNQNGFAHHLILLLIIVTISIFGVYYLTRSLAATDPTSPAAQQAPDDGNDDDSALHTTKATTARQVPSHRFYHKKGIEKRLENSIRGLKDAVSKGYKWIDLDAQYVWTNSLKNSRTIVNTHWAGLDSDCFIDPKSKISPTARWTNLTLAQAMSVRSGIGRGESTSKRLVCNKIASPYLVLPMTTMIMQAAQRGLSVELELKGGAAFQYPSNYKAVFNAAQQAEKKYHTKVWIKTLSNIGGTSGALKRLKAAHDAGFANTILLNHSGKTITLTKTQANYVTYWRGGANSAVRIAN